MHKRLSNCTAIRFHCSGIALVVILVNTSSAKNDIKPTEFDTKYERLLMNVFFQLVASALLKKTSVFDPPPSLSTPFPIIVLPPIPLGRKSPLIFATTSSFDYPSSTNNHSTSISSSFSSTSTPLHETPLSHPPFVSLIAGLVLRAKTQNMRVYSQRDEVT